MSEDSGLEDSSNLIRILHQAEYLLFDFAVTLPFNRAQIGYRFGVYCNSIFACIICDDLASGFKARPLGIIEISYPVL